MNQEWSMLNKAIQEQLKKPATFAMGIDTLLQLRSTILAKVLAFKDTIKVEDFYAMPFMNTNGYHNKSIAYSLYHIFRIEDIVANSLIKKQEDVFSAKQYQSRMNSPIITTGNELQKEEIQAFSKQLQLDELYQYILDVNKATASLLKQLTYADMKVKMTPEDEQRLQNLHVVSNDDHAVWLLDYWCGKSIVGLLQMPFSRHWIMHVEACLRIMNKLERIDS